MNCDYSWKDITPEFREQIFEFLKTHKKFQTKYLLKKLGVIKKRNGELKLKEK